MLFLNIWPTISSYIWGLIMIFDFWQSGVMKSVILFIIFFAWKKHKLTRLLFPNGDLTSSILPGGATYRRVVFSPGKSILGISGSCPSLFGGYLNGGRPHRNTFADPCSVPSSRKRRSINTLETKSFACWNLLQIYNILQGILLLWLTTIIFFAIQS